MSNLPWKEPGTHADTRRILFDSRGITLYPLVDCLRDSSAGFLPPPFSLIDSLSMDEGMIEGGGRFQPFGYKEIPFPDGSLLVRPKGRVAS